MQTAPLIALLAAVLIGGASAVHVGEAWAVNLPYKLGSSALSASGNGTFFATDINGTVWAINEASHRILWSLRWDDIAALYVVGDTLLVSLSQGLWAVRASTGRLRWVNNTVGLQTPYGVQPGSPPPFAVGGDVIAFYNAQSGPNEGGACGGSSFGSTPLIALNVLTGAEEWVKCAAANQGIGVMAVDSTVLWQPATPESDLQSPWTIATDVATGREVWRQAFWLTGSGGVLGKNAEYLVLLNASKSGSEYWIVVCSPKTGAEIRRLLVLTLYSSSNSFVDGKYLYGLGGNNQVTTLDKYDLENGYRLWQKPLPNSGGPFADSASATFTPYGIILSSGGSDNYNQLDSFSLVSMNGELTASIGTVPQTQNELAFFVLNGAYLLIPNLQGYTLWNAKTGAMVFKDYTLPGLTTAPVSLATGELVFAGGNRVFALRVTQ